ncbi:MAG: hypothetical protein M1814_004818 [Vezdaea aestivalis]|nr:MAG: hypothetical protein M1814_004818 [Vezdaea aestivalis]
MAVPSDGPSVEEIEVQLEPYPLYNTTFTLFRLGPLYYGNNTQASNIFDPALLASHAKKFHSLLKGDVLRGVRVGLAAADEDEGLSRMGALIKCEWRVIGDEEDWIRDQERNADIEREDEPSFVGDIVTENPKAIHVVIQYEKIEYVALLLKDTRIDEVDEDDGFAKLPLLLTRMPIGLRDTFTDFLHSTFDTHAAQLKLSSDFIVESLERYISDLIATGPSDVDIAELVEERVKDIQIVFGFGAGVAPLLKTLDITVSRADVWRLVQRGQAILSSKNGDSADLYIPAPSKRKRANLEASQLDRLPLVASLGSYLNEHLALDLSSKHIRIVRVACGAFVLGSEGKLKLLQGIQADEVTRRAIDSFMASLSARATNQEEG